MSKTIEQLKSRASLLLLQPYQTNQLVDEMCQIGWQLRHFDSDLACRLSEKASKIAVRNDYLRGRAFALVNIGWCQYYTDHYAQARLSFEESRQIFARLQDDAGLAAALNALGALLKISGDFENAIEHHQNALNLYEKLGEHSKIPILQMNFGTIYVRSADFSQALEHFYQGLAASDTEQPLAQAWIKNCLSDVLWRVGEGEQAVELLQQSIVFFR